VRADRRRVRTCRRSEDKHCVAVTRRVGVVRDASQVGIVVPTRRECLEREPVESQLSRGQDRLLDRQTG